MATEFARMRQLFATTADWGSNDIVLGSGEWGLELRTDGMVWGKVGDGVLTYSNLPYAIGESVDLVSDQSIGGIKTFTDEILVQNETSTSKTAQIRADDVLTIHSLFLDSKEIDSNVVIQARDSGGVAQTLSCNSDGLLRWNSVVIADDTGLAGVTWGGFNNLGVVERGTGFSVSHPATGQYDIVFDEASQTNVTQSVVASCNAQLASPLTMQVQMGGPTTCTIWVYDTLLDAAANSSISFIRNYIPA